MTALYIILGIILFFIAVLSIPVVLDLEYTDAVRCKVSWLFLKFTLYPFPEKKPKEEKPQEEKKEEKPEEKKEEAPKPKKPTLSEQAKKLSAFAAWAKAQADKNPEGVKDCLKLYGFDSIDSVTFDKIAAVTHAIQEL